MSKEQIFQIKDNAEKTGIMKIIAAVLLMVLVILGSHYASATEIQKFGQIILTVILFGGALVSGYFATTS